MVRGALFTRYFLEDGIRQMPQYNGVTAGDVEELGAAVRRHWAHLEQMPHPSEAETEAEFIFPILARLGWEHLPQQEPGRGRHDIADALLFLDAERKARARPLPAVDRFRLGAIVVENEARDTRLDRAAGNHEAPSSQILRYLGRAEPQSDGAVRWGLLTNGRFWRLYWAQARARAEGFVEIDLPALLGELPPLIPPDADPQHWLRVFMLLFGRNALTPEGARGETFLDLALAEGQRYEQRITEALSRAVFQNVYPDLVKAIGHAAPDPRPTDPAWRTEVRDASLRLLYRLLFLLYAEDRDLLPVHHDGYRQYALQPMRDGAAEIVDGRRAVSDRRTTWWPRLTNLFGAIAGGDQEMGLPPYNGGLFDERETPLLGQIALPDHTLAALIDALSRESGAKRWINYRDLSVQHLGSIYERLLEREVAADDAGELTLRPSIFARKATGSYYTPDELVRLILRRAVGPLLAERRQAFADRAEALAGDRRSVAERTRLLEQVDPAESFVKLRVCDPAMGSGHFLVSLVDYLADEVLTAIGEAPTLVPWADADRPYRSPLAERIERLRAEIRKSADRNNWPVSDEQLDDRHLVRRIILKRVIYGVDLNP
ncbi:MAG: Eco57I restriction-modification methylase domain-containing protein, partial [Stellaceae bacterium]